MSIFKSEFKSIYFNVASKQLVEHESCDCKYKLNESVCISKQKWNVVCRCECKELDRSIVFLEKGYMRNPSTTDCKCNKACKIDKYLDIKNCSSQKCLIGKLVLECEGEMLYTTETSFGDK